MQQSQYRDNFQTCLVFWPFTVPAHRRMLTTVKLYNRFPVGGGNRSGGGGNQRVTRGWETDELVLMQIHRCIILHRFPQRCLWHATLMVIWIGHPRLGGNLLRKQTAGCGNELKSVSTPGNACGDFGLHTYMYEQNKTYCLSYNSVALWCLLFDGYSAFRARHLGLFLHLSPGVREERREEVSGKGLPKGWPLEANHTPSAGFLYISGFCLDLTTRQRLVQT